MHIKSNHLEKTIEALKALSEGSGEVLGKSSNSNQAVSDDAHSEQTQETVIYISSSNENWISVLHDYFVWGTVKKAGKALSRLIEEPVMTVGFIHDEIFELSILRKGTSKPKESFVTRWCGMNMDSRNSVFRMITCVKRWISVRKLLTTSFG